MRKLAKPGPPSYDGGPLEFDQTYVPTYYAINMKKHEVLGVIVARGGSKSIPKKSIAMCAGYPLMYYTIKAAQKSKLIDRLIISTDSEEMAEVARGYGVEVPFIRPKELAEDDTMDHPVFEHALKYMSKEHGYNPDVVVQLRPTTPLKSSADIDKAIELLIKEPEADSVRSVCEPIHPPFKMYKHEGKFLTPLLKNEYKDLFNKYPEAFNMPRQKLPQTWRHSGYVDVTRPSVILEKGSMSGVKIIPLFFENWRDVDIDNPNDLKYAEVVINEADNIEGILD